MRKILYFTIPLLIFLACQSENEEDLFPQYSNDNSAVGDIIAHYMLDEKQVLDIAANLIYFGRSFTGKYTSATYFNGKFDDIRIYKRILSEEEILSLFDNYHAGY